MGHGLGWLNIDIQHYGVRIRTGFLAHAGETVHALIARNETHADGTMPLTYDVSTDWSRAFGMSGPGVVSHIGSIGTVLTERRCHTTPGARRIWHRHKVCVEPAIGAFAVGDRG